MLSVVLYWIAVGAVVAVVLRAIESFYIDEAFDLAMDLLFWPVAIVLHLKGKRDKVTSDSDTE